MVSHSIHYCSRRLQCRNGRVAIVAPSSCVDHLVRYDAGSPSDPDSKPKAQVLRKFLTPCQQHRPSIYVKQFWTLSEMCDGTLPLTEHEHLHAVGRDRGRERPEGVSRHRSQAAPGLLMWLYSHWQWRQSCLPSSQPRTSAGQCS